MSRIDPRTALSRLLAAGTPVSVEPVPLQEAGGRILARSLTADRDHPPADMSAMDGFAVRASDLAGAANPPAAEKRPAPIRLPVTGEARMGQPAEPLPPASAMRISTGAPLPPGSDTVVPVEEVESGPEAIRILHPAAGSVIPGRFVRARGSNLREGDPVLPPGTPITPGALGTLATFGLTRPSVYRQVRVAVVVTGDEVVAAFRRPAPAQIRDANGWIMEGFVRGLPWATLLSRTHAPDRVMPGVDPLREALRTGLDTADVLLVSGGVSAGHDDRVRPLLEGLGVRVLFHGVRSRPGRPLLAGVRGEGGTVVLGLPGNPVSVLACLRRFGLPLLRRRAGWATPVPPVGQLPLSAPVEADPILDRLLPAELDPDAGEAPRLRLVPFTGSGDLGAAARADGLVEIPAGAAGVGPFAFHSWTP